VENALANDKVRLAAATDVLCLLPHDEIDANAFEIYRIAAKRRGHAIHG